MLGVWKNAIAQAVKLNGQISKSGEQYERNYSLHRLIK
jgi:hypothetical protein